MPTQEFRSKVGNRPNAVCREHDMQGGQLPFAPHIPTDEPQLPCLSHPERTAH